MVECQDQVGQGNRLFRAHKCYKIAGIKSVSKHYKYKKPGDSFKTYPNLLLAGINIAGPMECVVSDMTAFYVRGIYYELTLYMDLWNDELIAHSLSSKRGDRMIYLNGLQDVIKFKKQYPNQEGNGSRPSAEERHLISGHCE